MAKFFLTTPIYYVNDVPHIGHAYTTVAADALARYYRGLGRDVFFLTGTDEHGAKVAEAAAQRGVAPQEFVDEIVASFKDAWRRLDISHDYFVRTSDERHEKAVQRFFERWHDSGDFYKGIYRGKYCVSCEQFYAEDELTDGLCPQHLKPPIDYAEENYFFRLSRYGDTLLRAVTDTSDPNYFAIEPPARRNEVIGKLRAGLQDISISRGTLKWGVPLPWDPSQVAYVWIDALLNYITAVGYADDQQTFERYWPADLHLIGKDIVWFHCVIWPAMLISAGVPVPRRVFAHGFFTIGGQRMSKTIGNVIAPGDLVDRYGADASRYLLLSEFQFGADGNFSIDSFNKRFNADLANDLGNLLNRTVSMVNRYFEGTVPATDAAPQPIDDDLRTATLALASRVEHALASLEFAAAIEAIRGVVSQANRYVDTTQPWALARSDRSRLATVLGHLLETLRLVAIELGPFMPTSTADLCRQLGLDPAAPGDRTWSGPGSLCRVATVPRPLFPKIES